MLILVKNFDSAKEAGLLKSQLKENNIEAHCNELGSRFEDHRYPAGHALAVEEDSFEKALQVLSTAEKHQKVLNPHQVRCPNCGSRSLKGSDLVKGNFKKAFAYCRSGMSAMLFFKKSKYHICFACGLEYTKAG